MKTRISQNFGFKRYIQYNFRKTESSTINKNDIIALLPFDLNFYDELESIFVKKIDDEFFVIKERVGKDNIDLKEKIKLMISKYIGFELDDYNYPSRVILYPSLYLDENKKTKIFFAFVNVTGNERKLAENIKEIDLPLLPDFPASDVILMFMISVVSSLVLNK